MVMTLPAASDVISYHFTEFNLKDLLRLSYMNDRPPPGVVEEVAGIIYLW